MTSSLEFLGTLNFKHCLAHLILETVLSETSLLGQWLTVRLPMQGTQVRSLVWNGPTCCGATKPMRRNC